MRTLAICLSLVLMGCGSTASSGNSPATDTATAADTATVTDTVRAADTETAADTATQSDSPASPVVDADNSYPEAPEELGGARPAKYVLPSQYSPAKKWPVVMVLHGYGANLGNPAIHAGVVQDSYLGISARGSELGFITLLPHGTVDATGKQFWNATPACCDFGFSGIDDVGYLIGLLDEAALYFNIDPKRIYLIGHSNGGFMSYRLACQAGERFAAFVSIAGLTFWNADGCSPGTAKVSVLQVHGTVDGTIPYGGATYKYPSAQKTVERWVERNGCEPAPVTGTPINITSNIAGPETTVQTWEQCEDNTAVALWSLQAVGHIPGFTSDFSAAALNFLLTKSRP